MTSKSFKHGDLCEIAAVAGQYYRVGFLDISDRTPDVEIPVGTLCVVLDGPKKKNQKWNKWSYLRVMTHMGVFWVFADAVGTFAK